MLHLPKAEEPTGLNAFPVFYWNHAGLQLNRIATSLQGPQGGPTMGSRALGLLQLAMHDAFFGVMQPELAYLPNIGQPAEPIPTGPARLSYANAALSGAAVTMLTTLYGAPGTNIPRTASTALRVELDSQIRDYGQPLRVLEAPFTFGTTVARAIFELLGVKPGEIGADAGPYEPSPDRYKFRDEPLNPVRLQPLDPDHPERGMRAVRIYHGPFYGRTVPAFAVTDPDGHALAPPPVGTAVYDTAVEEVIRLGGAPGLSSTERTPDETVSGYYWAYDGSNLIGTPPRLYNQIVRIIAWDKKSTDDPTHAGQTAEFVRLLALVNVAMADAGKFAWLEKYKYELWRPLSGVREHDASSGPSADAKTATAELAPLASPFWRALGAPETNTNRISFKPPFPAYPSGHATFGAACLHMVNLFYRDRAAPDAEDLEALPAFTGCHNPPPTSKALPTIGFSFVSDELNGLNRDLHQAFDPASPIEDQPGDVRTRVVRCFNSLPAAIFENAFSRIWLGVHWSFDAFDPADITKNGRSIDPSPATEGCNPKSYRGYGDPDTIEYSHVWQAARGSDDPLPTGGVPLGLGIANDIYASGMRAQSGEAQQVCDKMFGAAAAAALAVPEAKLSNTNIS